MDNCTNGMCGLVRSYKQINIKNIDPVVCCQLENNWFLKERDQYEKYKNFIPFALFYKKMLILSLFPFSI